MTTSREDRQATVSAEPRPAGAEHNRTTSYFLARYGTIRKLKYEIDKKQRHVDNERQSKKRFEINDELKKLKEQLAILEN